MYRATSPTISYKYTSPLLHNKAVYKKCKQTYEACYTFFFSYVKRMISVLAYGIHSYEYILALRIRAYTIWEIIAQSF